jgi:hypothetical protein
MRPKIRVIGSVTMHQNLILGVEAYGYTAMRRRTRIDITKIGPMVVNTPATIWNTFPKGTLGDKMLWIYNASHSDQSQYTEMN